MQNEPLKLPRECSINGRLTISSDDVEIFIEADEQQVKVILPAEISLTSKASAKHKRTFIEVLSAFHRALDQMGIKVEGYYAGKHVAVLGRGSKPGLISKSVRLGPLELKALPFLAALIDRKSLRIKKRLSD